MQSSAGNKRNVVKMVVLLANNKLTPLERAANDIITLNFSSATVQLAATHPAVTFLRESLSIQFHEGQSRHKCKHISVIIEAGTHKAKYRAVMQSVTWL